MRLRSLFGLAAVFAVSGAASEAHAGGLFISDRGVRPLGRGGAFVAGADDLGSIAYNPAGLADAGTSILVDFAWVNFNSEFTRTTNVTTAGGTVQPVEFPTVQGKSPFLPIPTMAASYNFGAKKEFTAAGGIYAPYTPIATYPLTVDGEPSPSRYSLVSLEGSALVNAGAYFAYKPMEQLRIGGGLQALVGNFNSQVVFSASPPGRVIGAPEDPQYDTFSQMSVGPIVAPSATFGMIGTLLDHFRVGASVQLPFWINAPAKVDVRLPTAAPFDKARQDGNEANVRFRLPLIARAGIEYRTNLGDSTELRAEVAYVREFWSLHDSIDVRPQNVALYGVTGFPSPFGIATISLPRNFKDSNSFRFGSELSLKDVVGSTSIDLRAGASYETSAIPLEWVSPLSYDANKFIPSVGGSLRVGEHWRFDAVFALVVLADMTIDPADAKVPRVNPVQGNPTATEAINGGTYHASATIAGAGVNYRF